MVQGWFFYKEEGDNNNNHKNDGSDVDVDIVVLGDGTKKATTLSAAEDVISTIHDHFLPHVRQINNK